ncbi:hypothetical protein [Enterococcus rivorum]|uniref:hypothetical protein n=1 Tax=Enterococcus rivorum TaxID=762845 RepID=UPI00084F6A59|nr:hypothetical protein [Enterococcus rivorum]MBP2097246.1 uncharacterized SAM-binding protein YcdF (DUF218 family) [Enterococcus rivorum]
MIDYLWMFILGGISILALFFFLVTLSRDTFLIKKLRKKKQVVALNFSLLFISLGCLGTIVYLFSLLKTQIELLQ